MKTSTILIIGALGVGALALSRSSPVSEAAAKTAYQEYITEPLGTSFSDKDSKTIQNYTEQLRGAGFSNADVVNKFAAQNTKPVLNAQKIEIAQKRTPSLASVAVSKFIQNNYKTDITPSGSLVFRSPTSTIKIKGVDY